MKYKAIVQEIMKRNNFDLIRENKYLVWQHQVCGGYIVTSNTPSSAELALKKINNDINNLLTSPGV